MSLTTLIQKGGLRGLATATPATPATDKPDFPPTVATVATVAVANAPNTAASDAADAGPATLPAGTPDRLRAASLALDAVILASDIAADPDRWCWPQSTALNTAEIDTFTARLSRFTDRGLIVAFAESLADKLVIRDREGDDRALCLECPHLGGYSGSWRCGAWKRAGIATRAGDARLASDEVTMLRRCDGFT